MTDFTMYDSETITMIRNALKLEIKQAIDTLEKISKSPSDDNEEDDSFFIFHFNEMKKAGTESTLDDAIVGFVTGYVNATTIYQTFKDYFNSMSLKESAKFIIDSCVE